MILFKQSIAAFLEVFESRSVSSAAKKIGLTQTGVTQRIKSLESDLGVSLFVRSRSGMRPTSEGLELYRHCQEVKGLEGKLLSGIGKNLAAEELSLCVVGPASLLGGRVIPACAGMSKKWQNLSLNFLVDVNAKRIEHLKRGTADIGIVLEHQVAKELDSKKLKPMELVLVASSAWRGRKLKEILAEEKLVSYHEGDNSAFDYLRSFGLLDSLKKNRIFMNENQCFLQLLKAGAGFGVLARELVEEGLKSGELIALNQGRSFPVPVALAWYPRKEMPDYFREIIKNIH